MKRVSELLPMPRGTASSIVRCILIKTLISASSCINRMPMLLAMPLVTPSSLISSAGTISRVLIVFPNGTSRVIVDDACPGVNVIGRSIDTFGAGEDASALITMSAFSIASSHCLIYYTVSQISRHVLCSGYSPAFRRTCARQLPL